MLEASEAAADQALQEEEQQAAGAEDAAGATASAAAAAAAAAADKAAPGCGVHSMHCQALACLPGAAVLAVRLLLPYDLVEGGGAPAVLQKLREVAQVRLPGHGAVPAVLLAPWWAQQGGGGSWGRGDWL
jgi:hypothetical protein